MGNIKLDFEKPIIELQEKMNELERFSDEQYDVQSEINMEEKILL